MKNRRISLLISFLLISGLGVTNLSSAHATPNATTPIATTSGINGTPNLNQGLFLDRVEANMSVGGFFSWICKTIVTLVGIGAYVIVFVESNGKLVAVSKWVVKYVSVPSLVCSWI